MIKGLWVGIVVGMVAAPLDAPLAAQAQRDSATTLVAMVQQAQPQRYEPIDCLGDGHYKVKSAKTTVKSALEASNKAAVPGMLERARRVVTEAISQNGQDVNPGAWYWLGRIYLYEGDLAGADSALTKAGQLADPACAKEMNLIRITTANALLRPGLDLMQAGQSDSATRVLKLALHFYGDTPSPYAFSTLGGYYYNTKKMLDSAAFYFAKAVDASGKDTLFREVRESSQFNLAVALQNNDQDAEAASAYNKYLLMKPNDLEAMKGLAAALRSAGQTDSAQVIEKKLLDIPGGEQAGANAAAVTTVDIFNLGVSAFQDSNYADAAKAFGQVLDREPNNRDAERNLAFTYVQMKDGARLLPIAKRLYEREPLNETNVRLLANAYGMTGDSKQQEKLAYSLIQLPVNIQIQEFTVSGDDVTLKADAEGRDVMNQAGKSVAPKPVTVSFEFLDQAGGVVATKDVTIPAVAKGASDPIAVEADGAGIVAFRYHLK